MSFFSGETVAQNCDNTVPTHTIDLRGNPDSTWTVTDNRQGHCCSASGSTRCIYFNVMLDSFAQGIVVDVAGGTGTTYYDLGCSTSTLVGDTFCVTGPGPHEITVCKPGGNAQHYTIKSIAKPRYTPNSVVTYYNCPQLIQAVGLNKSTITWEALGSSTYNSYLSCTTGCDSVYVTFPSAGAPSYIDVKITGYSYSTCDTSRYIDTVRASLVSLPEISIVPADAAICPGTSATGIKAVAGNGLPPYEFTWNTGQTTDSITVGTGTYIVTLTDSLGCSQPKDTIIITNFPGVTIHAGNDTIICEGDPVTLSGHVEHAPELYWYGGSGSFIPDSVSANAEYHPSAAEVSAGFVELNISSAGAIPCDHKTDQVRITINPKPATPAINH